MIPQRVTCVVGARPNFMKVAPVHQALARRGLEVRLVHTGQHYDDKMSAVFFDDLYDLGCWIAKTRLYVGNDSGISHLAAAVGTPTVAIFLSTDPRIWAPRGGHVTVLEKPTLEAAAALCAERLVQV